MISHFSAQLWWSGLAAEKGRAGRRLHSSYPDSMCCRGNGRPLCFLGRTLIGQLTVVVLLHFGSATASGQTQAESPVRLELVEVRKIWDLAAHNAFTDLVTWRDRLYCAFREGEGHAGDLGKLRVISSDDGREWSSAGLLELPTHDLRDAALSVTPDDRLMLLGGAQHNQAGERSTGSFVSFSEDGTTWSAPELVVPLGRWLWRVTWHNNEAYGVAYPAGDGSTHSSLLRTQDGTIFEVIVPQLLSDGGQPTEARLRFGADGTAYCLHRRDATAANSAFLGESKPPYDAWQWQDLDVPLGGPNFLQCNGVWLAAGRLYDPVPRTQIAWLDIARGRLVPLLKLPSGGDTSYPGMIWRDQQLWLSYYSSHEGQANIYLARVRVIPN